MYPQIIKDPQDAPYILCTRCMGEIYEGEQYGTNGKDRICADCADTLWQSYSTGTRFLLLGYQIEKVEVGNAHIRD